MTELAPTEFKLFPFGEIATTKGNFLFDKQAAKSIVAEAASYGNDLSIDYEHQAVQEVPQVSPAAGWFRLQLRDDGLYAVGVRWTDRAQKFIQAGEYRYFSPAFETDEAGYRIERLINVALTNLPATKSMPALVAARRKIRTTAGVTLCFFDGYAKEDFVAPWGVRQAMFSGLKYLEEGYGDSLPPSLVRWAKFLAEGNPISPDRARIANQWLSKQSLARKTDPLQPKTPQYTAYLLWGGTPGGSWVRHLVKKMDKIDGRTTMQKLCLKITKESTMPKEEDKKAAAASPADDHEALASKPWSSEHGLCNQTAADDTDDHEELANEMPPESEPLPVTEDTQASMMADILNTLMSILGVKSYEEILPSIKAIQQVNLKLLSNRPETRANKQRRVELTVDKAVRTGALSSGDRKWAVDLGMNSETQLGIYLKSSHPQTRTSAPTPRQEYAPHPSTQDNPRDPLTIMCSQLGIDRNKVLTQLKGAN